MSQSPAADLAQESTAIALIHRGDYTPPPWWVDTVDLTFDLDPQQTRVLNKMRVRRNPHAAQPQPLRLDGEALELVHVRVNGHSATFKVDGAHLLLENLPEGDEALELEILSTCAPQQNTQLSGLYVSQGTFFTQCEAEGFRRITYFPDRPDVMATYTVTLRADKRHYPVLLSNGNLVDQGDLAGARHYATWADPHKKPSYLFALVAGNLVAREQKITSRAGSTHLLQIYVRAGDLEKTEHAMQSLMAAIAWDEARFGLSLDLERFMIVATSDFNMGAMENKGLNIFNTKYVLASQASATDADYAGIESVVAHEYFHNWTGNRVTCRDWFQLSLKEGLTVFRDQEFSMDMAGAPSARAVKRIEDVRMLRAAQFPEDAGPLAHPVRPDSYAEINNFYTVTIYEKGAEVVRMQHTLLGREGFARGMQLYFERHDGQAVTCDDFVQAMADANPHSALAQHLHAFKRWYSQAGTPRVHASGQYDASAHTYTLTLSQSCPATPGQSEKQPFVIPVRMGLLNRQGKAMSLRLPGEDIASTGKLLVLHQAEQSYVFTGIEEEPIASLLRGFSAPVILHQELSDAQLLVQLRHDSDPFNQWEAAQRLALRVALPAITAGEGAPIPPLPAAHVEALRSLLRHPLDAAFKHLVLTLPGESYMAEQLPRGSVNPQRIHAVREAMRTQLAVQLREDWQWAWDTHKSAGAVYRPDAQGSGRRALADLALHMLCLAARVQHDAVWPGKTLQAFKDAGNMTERLSAISALVHSAHPLAARALERFYAQFRHDPLVLDKWFALQASAHAGSDGHDTLTTVQRLLQHPDFSLHNPNRARSLLFTYCNANPAAFHRVDGAGYAFWCEQVLALDAINPQVAARLARALDRWQQLAPPWRDAARQAIAQVAERETLSRDVREVVHRALGSVVE